MEHLDPMVVGALFGVLVVGAVVAMFVTITGIRCCGWGALPEEPGREKAKAVASMLV